MVAGALAQLRRAIDLWLFRVGPTEAGPIMLGQRRIFVLPTPAGLALAAALAVMLLAAINYNLSLGHGFVFLIAGIAVTSMVHAFRNLLHLSISAGKVAPVFAGAHAQFRLHVGNTRQTRRPALKLKIREQSTDFDIAASDVADVTLPVPTRRRGWLPLGRTSIETTWPLGLVRAWSVMVPDASCLVYPAPETSPPPLPEGNESTFGRRSGRTGDDDFAGLRAHRQGDSPRHIAWKAVARGGPVVTKQFLGMDGGTVSLDWGSLPDTLDTEARLSRLTAWVLLAQERCIAYSLHLPSTEIAADSGVPHAQACLRALALFDSAEPADD